MGKTYGRYSVRSLSYIIFYLNLWDIVTDITYYLSRDFVSVGLGRVCLLSLLLNSLGILVILVVGFAVNCLVRYQSDDHRTTLCEDFMEMTQFWHALYFKTVLELPQVNNKAIHRTSLLVHLVLEAIPQLIIQGINNYRLDQWLYPLSLLSYSSSITMFLVAAFTLYQTDKYGGYY